MDTNKLFKAIQIIVQEEVKKEVAKREKAIRESILKEIKQSKPKQIEKDPLDVEHVFESTTPKKKSGPKFEGKFASLLNETADGGEWKSINSMGGSFNSNQAMAWGGMSNQTPGVLQTAEGSAIPVEQLKQTPAGEAVVNALTRDYSGLMKAINAKKGK